MKAGRAVFFGIVGALAISGASAALRAAGVPLQIETILGTVTGMPPGPDAFALGLAIHLAIGATFALGYAWLFENVWDHGGAGTGMLLSILHAALIGMFIGLTPQFHPLVPERIPNPGPYFANAGVVGVVAFFGLHVVYGAIVGAGYGHVAAEHEWTPAERM